MKTSFPGSKVLCASAFAGLVLCLCSVISTSCGKYSARIKEWNAKYEYEISRNELENERQINAIN